MSKKQNQIEEDTYKTKSLHEAAYLYTEKCPFIKLEISHLNSEEYLFVFQNKKKCSKLCKTFWQNEGSVAPRLYSENIREFRHKIYDAQKKKR